MCGGASRSLPSGAGSSAGSSTPCTFTPGGSPAVTARRSSSAWALSAVTLLRLRRGGSSVITGVSYAWSTPNSSSGITSPSITSRAPGQSSPGPAYPLGNLVDRNAHHDQHAEQQQQDQQRHGDVHGQQIGEQAGGDVAEDAAGLPQLLGRVGPGQPAGDVDQAEQAEHDRGPADELAPARSVAVGVAQRPPRHQGQQHRGDVGQRADDAGDPDPDAVTDRTGQTPPELGPHHDGAADQEQSDPVPAQRRIHVAGPRAHAPGGIPGPLRQTGPGGGEPVAQHAAVPSGGASAPADACGSATPRGGVWPRRPEPSLRTRTSCFRSTEVSSPDPRGQKCYETAVGKTRGSPCWQVTRTRPRVRESTP